MPTLSVTERDAWLYVLLNTFWFDWRLPHVYPEATIDADVNSIKDIKSLTKSVKECTIIGEHELGKRQSELCLH